MKNGEAIKGRNFNLKCKTLGTAGSTPQSPPKQNTMPDSSNGVREWDSTREKEGPTSGLLD